MQYDQGQRTVPRLVAQRRAIGLCILRIIPAGLQPQTACSPNFRFGDRRRFAAG